MLHAAWADKDAETVRADSAHSAMKVAQREAQACKAAVSAGEEKAAAEAAKAQGMRDRMQCALDEAQRQIEALGAAPSRTAVWHNMEQQRRGAAADAAELVRKLKRQAEATQQLFHQACHKTQELGTQLRSEQTRRGNAIAELETANAKLAKVEAAAQDTTLRNLKRREASRAAELNTAREEVRHLRERISELEACLPLGERSTRLCPMTAKLQQVRVRGGDENAPLTGRSIEHLRRLVDETNGSFEGAATANALVLAMHLGEVAEDRLISAGSIRNAFHRGGLADEEVEAERNQADRGPWCIAQDAGGGTLMVATGQWDFESEQPVAQPLAAADLFRDQSARNGITTLEAAARRGGLKFDMIRVPCRCKCVAIR
jgi:hypothetical protein